MGSSANKGSRSGKRRRAKPGWLANDELTAEWLRQIEEYRAECDAADRRRLLLDNATAETPR
jgi:hypothetical protein